MDKISLEFFFDPICPWAYITSRTMVEVRKVRPVEITWRFISLIVVNEDKYGWSDATDERHRELHERGSKLLRVAAYVRRHAGQEGVETFYTEVGRALHVEKKEEEQIFSLLADLFARLSLPPSPSPEEVAKSAEFDQLIREETQEALGRCGPDVGTPIITYDAPDGPTFFGPVLSRILKGEQAGQFFDHLYAIAKTDGFSELKRSARPPRVLD